MTPPRQIPPDMLAAFTMDGRIPVIEMYQDDSKSEPTRYSSESINDAISAISVGKLGHYGYLDKHVYAALNAFPIAGKRVCVFGSAEQGYGPWYESMVLAYGGRPTVIDYNTVEYGDQRIEFIPHGSEPDERFDAGISISSFEHSGLGRYGDELDPRGDLRAMVDCMGMIKVGGLLYLSVPMGRDKVAFNCHRIYGIERFRLLLTDWKLVDIIGEASLTKDTGNGWDQSKVGGGRDGLGMPEQSAVFVLRNE